MPETLVTIAYLAAGILFIFSLGGLSAQESARRGNLFGIIGMVNFAHGDVFMVSSFIALIIYLVLTQILGVGSLAISLLIGSRELRTPLEFVPAALGNDS